MTAEIVTSQSPLIGSANANDKDLEAAPGTLGGRNVVYQHVSSSSDINCVTKTILSITAMGLLSGVTGLCMLMYTSDDSSSLAHEVGGYMFTVGWGVSYVSLALVCLANSRLCKQ